MKNVKNKIDPSDPDRNLRAQYGSRRNIALSYIAFTTRKFTLALNAYVTL